MQKFDPYINVDPGTMNPYQHGEVFVTDDGAETDLDLGHYERFIDESLNAGGQRYQRHACIRPSSPASARASIWARPSRSSRTSPTRSSAACWKFPSRKTRRMWSSPKSAARSAISSPCRSSKPARQLKSEVGRENVLYIHVTLVPYLSAAGELKTKPTQHSVKELAGLGIQPDIIVCRSEKPIPRDVRAKIGLFCNIPADCVFENLNARSIYEVPLMIHEEGMDERVCRLLGISAPEADLTEWREMVERLLTPQKDVRIAIVGKYVELPDAYLSIVEALTHGGIAHHAKVRVEWIAAEEVTPENVREKLAGCSGVLVPGGFGERGLEGKIAAVQYARENNVPFLGICLGMQMAVVEYARHVLGLTGAHTSEVDPNTPYPVIDLMPDQQNIDEKGGTMRLGKYPCRLNHDSISYAAYGEENIFERHRHRYEFNNVYRDQVCGERHAHRRREPGSRSGGDRRAAEPSVVRRCAVSSGAQEPSEPSASAVPRVRRRGACLPG